MDDDRAPSSVGPMPSSFDSTLDFFNESRWQKIRRRLYQEPLVPIGCVATCYALYRATIAMRRGQHKETNRMFRWRIYAQAFTIVAIVAGSTYYQDDRRLERAAAAEKKRLETKDKRDKWIRELEAREKEDQVWEEKQRRHKRDQTGLEKERRGGDREAATVASQRATGRPNVDGAVGSDFTFKSALEPREGRSLLLDAARAFYRAPR